MKNVHSRIIINNRTHLDDATVSTMVMGWLSKKQPPSGAVVFNNGYALSVETSGTTRRFDVLKQKEPNILGTED